MIWYMNITCQVITPDSKHIPLPTNMQYEQHVQWIQNTVSNQIFLELIYAKCCILFINLLI
jgi:hypothetical protein